MLRVTGNVCLSFRKGSMSGRQGRLRSYRRQGLAGVSTNGYTYLVLVLFWLPSVALFLEFKLGGSTFVGWAVGLIWIAALIASVVVATADDSREGTGQWFGDNDRHNPQDK